jgi:hypothetical protein
MVESYWSYCPGNCLDDLRKTTKKLQFRKVAVPITGKTEELMNTNLDHYSDNNLLNNYVNKML